MWVYGLDWAGPGQRQMADACAIVKLNWWDVKTFVGGWVWMWILLVRQVWGQEEPMTADVVS